LLGRLSLERTQTICDYRFSIGEFLQRTQLGIELAREPEIIVIEKTE